MKKHWAAAVLAVWSIGVGEAQSLTAGEVISRIKENVTVSWSTETVDTYKGGSPDMKVSGIATTFLATLEVLQKAKAEGLNMVITHEPTFYDHFDHTDRYGQDAIVAAKEKFIADNHMVVFRFHDHIHATQPDGIYQGILDKMGWKPYQESERPYIYHIPKTTLGNLANSLRKTFDDTPIMRVVGDPDLEVDQAAMVLGAAGADRQIAVLQRDDVEVLIIGETHEWETVEYVRDAVALGKKKALIILGHANSEEAGMIYAADWLRKFIPEVPVKFIAAGEPFWVPQGD